MKYIAKFWKSYNLDKAFFFVFYMAMCFPFVGNFHQTDTQPWALLLAILFVSIYILRRGERPYNFYSNALFGFFSICIVIGCLSMKQVGGYTALMRSGANYASVFFITMGVYYMLKIQGGIKEEWLKFIIIVWLFFGLVQKNIDFQFGKELLAKFRTDSMRGVCSLASEPSFYGYMCLFFILFAVEFKRLRWLYVAILLYEIVFLASSAVAIIYLGVIVFCWFVWCILRGKKFAWGLIPVGIAMYFEARRVIDNVPQSVRALDLLRKFLYRPDLLANDDSVTIRVKSITTSVEQFIDNIGFPGGMSSIRITSGYGAMLVELGLIGLFAIVLFYMLIREGKYGAFMAPAMTIIMFSGIQLACPMFSFYLGYCLYKKLEKNTGKQMNREDM